MAKDKDWNADKEGEFEDADRYRGREGYNDIIVVISGCKSTPRHWTGKKYPQMKFYLRCLEEGAEPEKNEGACCKEFGKASPSNTAYIIHVAERKGNGKWERVGKPKVWGFGEKTRKDKIGVILRDYCENDASVFRKTRLLITCSDKVFQDISIIACNSKDEQAQMTKDMLVAAKEKKDMFAADVALDKDNIISSLARLHGERVDGVDSPGDSDNSVESEAAESTNSGVSAEEFEKELDDFMDGMDEEDNA